MLDLKLTSTAGKLILIDSSKVTAIEQGHFPNTSTVVLAGGGVVSVGMDWAEVAAKINQEQSWRRKVNRG